MVSSVCCNFFYRFLMGVFYKGNNKWCSVTLMGQQLNIKATQLYITGKLYNSAKVTVTFLCIIKLKQLIYTETSPSFLPLHKISEYCIFK